MPGPTSRHSETDLGCDCHQFLKAPQIILTSARAETHSCMWSLPISWDRKETWHLFAILILDTLETFEPKYN